VSKLSEEKPNVKTLPIAGIIFVPGSAKEYNTGSFRNQRPILDAKKCTKCGMCWVYCPDGAIYLNSDKVYEINLKYCKGCGICAEECAPKAIKMVDEEE
jgi:pyruvate ferredoxin oxidoreductase delta subunit